jgi:hypothetical protein
MISRRQGGFLCTDYFLDYILELVFGIPFYALAGMMISKRMPCDFILRKHQLKAGVFFAEIM